MFCDSDAKAVLSSVIFSSLDLHVQFPYQILNNNSERQLRG